MASKNADRTEWLNVIGVYSPFHESFGYYADPVDHKTATLPGGRKGRLVSLPVGTPTVFKGYVWILTTSLLPNILRAGRKDIVFTRELAKREIVSRDRLFALLDQTPVSEEVRRRIHTHIANDFGAQEELDDAQQTQDTGRQSVRAKGSLSLEEIRAQARKDWLRLREQQRGVPGSTNPIGITINIMTIRSRITGSTTILRSSL